MQRLTLTLLGGFHGQLSLGSPLVLPRHRGQALLAYLALPLGQPHTRGKLANLLWGDQPSRQARMSVRQLLFSVRRALADSDGETLLLEGDSVALNPAAVDLDVAAFERAVADGSRAALEHAVTLYSGELLAGLDVRGQAFDEWMMSERVRLKELATGTLSKLLGQQRAAGDLDAAVQSALRLLALDPLQESAHRMLMRLYAEQGRWGAALRHYQHCVGVLQRELDVEPEPETRALYQEILRQRPSSVPRAGTARASERPSSDVARRTSLETLKGEPPLIGREDELTQLRSALDEGWAGRGRLVAIVGEAGVGKSRIVGQLLTEVVRRGGRALVGRSFEAEQVLPFAPWVHALRGGGVATDEDLLARLGPVWRAELARLLPELANAALPSPVEHLRLFESVEQLVKQLAERAPLLVILEDVHWADEMSVRLLAFLGRALATSAALVVVTVREEELAETVLLRRTLEDLERARCLTRLALAPLSPADTLALVSALVSAGSDEALVDQLGARVWEIGEGNPLVTVEALRALREAPGLETLPRLLLPERVQEIIARRLERLEKTSSHVLAVAATIGREFEFSVLQRAVGRADSDVAECVEDLVRRRLLHVVDERLDFTHARIREVVASQILPPRRRIFHASIADAVETVHEGNLEPHYAALASHYRDAEVWHKAVTYLRLAGTQATNRAAHREALAWLEDARTIVGRLPESRSALELAIDVRLDLYHALFPLGEPKRSLARLDEAVTLAKTLGDDARLARALAYLANCLWLAGESDAAVEAAERARVIGDARGDFALRVVANFYLGQIHHFRGDYRRAADALRACVDSLAANQLNDSLGLLGLPGVLSRGWLAWSLSELGEFAAGVASGDEAVHIAETAGHVFSRLDAYREIGCLYIRQGDLSRAMTVLERALDLCRDRNVPLWLPSIGAALGYAYALAGRVREGVDLLEQAVTQAESHGIAAGHSLRSAWLGEAYLLAGRSVDAGRVTERALRLSEERKEHGNRAWILRLLGDVATQADTHELERATAFYEEAMHIAHERGMRPLLAHCHFGCARLHRRAGDQESADHHLGAAVAVYRETGMQFWLEKAQTER